MNTATRRLEKISCPKCEGLGRVSWAGHVDGGKCYDCNGKRFIEIDALTPNEKIDRLVCQLKYSARIALELASAGRVDLAKGRLDGMVAEMFMIGTTRARAVIAELRAGVYFDHDTDGRMTAAPAHIDSAIAYLIAAGRAAKAN